MKFLLLCSIILSGLWSEASSYMSVSEGQSAVLDCPLRTDNSSRRVVSWYRQNHGEGPQMVLSYPTTNTSRVSYGHGFNSSRFTVQTKANETTRHQLLITPAKERDTAVYFCSLSMPTESNRTKIQKKKNEK
ncbi:secreted immunoglobulin domain 1 [Conger conger]|uniref:secreted immunoglobulin domain 1 n=1 Tax=Conger conger TaxID=82655 RepID=UPI002A59C6C7|nr:secreted immunoglobulin domain 1 [Conger conger]